MSGGGRARAGQRAAPGAARLGARLAAIVAALALLVQLAVVPFHQARAAPAPETAAATDIATATAQLKALFGDVAALCVESDGKSGPAAPGGDCDDHCPLCRFASQAAALLAPDLPVPPERFDSAPRRLGVEPETGAVPAPPPSRHRARAPPFAI